MIGVIASTIFSFLALMLPAVESRESVPFARWYLTTLLSQPWQFIIVFVWVGSFFLSVGNAINHGWKDKGARVTLYASLAGMVIWSSFWLFLISSVRL